MADEVFRLTAPMAVEPFEGLVAAWAQREAGQVILIFDPGAADETGRRLRSVTREQAEAALPSGHIVEVSIAPPTGSEEPADIVFTFDTGESATLTIPLQALVQLAQTAQAALAAVAPAGRA